MSYQFKIKGLDCANCAAELERVLQKIKGVKEVSINFITQKMHLECEEVGAEEILKQVTKKIKKEEPDVTLEEV